MTTLHKIDIAKLLKEEKLSTEQNLQKAIERSTQNGKPLEENAISMGFVDQEKLAHVLAEHMEIEFVDLASFPIQHEAATSIPENVVRDNTALPILKVKDLLTIAMFTPLNMEAIEEIEYHSNCKVRIVISTYTGIKDAIEKFFGVYGKISKLLREIDETSLGGADPQEVTDSQNNNVEEINLHTEEGPIANIVTLLISQTVKIGGSDIHIEPLENSLRVRMRVDGLLQEAMTFKKVYQSAITASIKIMSQMDIAERRAPQDGRFRISVDRRKIDLRVSSFPASYGEKIVIRILDKSSLLIDLKDIGFSSPELKKLKEIIFKPFGIFLVTGPTGSGKTTSLYTFLRHINDVKKNIVTLEDPVEYDLENINQGQVNIKSGLTFAKGLRSILRQDPDIIMIGEIRDSETAEIAIQSALTGHLVLSTLHTNDAPSAANRLVDMGVEPFLIASAIEGVLSQRLARKVCKKCKEEYDLSQQLVDRFKLKEKNPTFFRAKGCRECNRTGYKGRLGIYELMTMNDELKKMIVAKSSSTELKNSAVRFGMTTLQQDGISKALEGITTLEEVLRVAGGND